MQTWARAKIQIGELKIFQLGESNQKLLRRGRHQNSTRGVGPFFAKKNFSGRGVKIFQLGESNSENLNGGVIKIQLGEWDLFWQRKIFQVGE